MNLNLNKTNAVDKAPGGEKPKPLQISEALNLIDQSINQALNLLQEVRKLEFKQQIKSVGDWIKTDFKDESKLSEFYCETLNYYLKQPNGEHRGFVKSLLSLKSNPTIKAFFDDVLIKQFPELILNHQIDVVLRKLKNLDQK